MRYTIVTCVFPPEPVVSAQTSTQIAVALQENGHQVTVLTTFPNRPAGKVYSGYRRCIYQWENIEQPHRILRCFATISFQSKLYSRFLENITFGITSGLALLFLQKPDVVYANTWPIFATGILMAVARVRRIPVVLSIQDVYPESLLTQNRIKKTSFLVKILKKIDAWIAKQARSVILISERFANIYRHDRQIPNDKVIVVSNWVDETATEAIDRNNEIRERNQIGEHDFLMVYGGNIGIAAGVEAVIRAMTHLPSSHRIHLLIAGEGSELSICQDLARDIDEKRIHFHTPWPLDETSLVLGAADVLVLSTRGEQSAVSVPSKLISYMFSARPVIAMVGDDTDTADAIRQSECGWVIPPDQPEQLATLVKRLSYLHREQLQAMGQAGRQYAERHFSRNVNLPEVLKALGVRDG